MVEVQPCNVVVKLQDLVEVYVKKAILAQPLMLIFGVLLCLFCSFNNLKEQMEAVFQDFEPDQILA